MIWNLDRYIKVISNVKFWVWKSEKIITNSIFSKFWKIKNPMSVTKLMVIEYVIHFQRVTIWSLRAWWKKIQLVRVPVNWSKRWQKILLFALFGSFGLSGFCCKTRKRQEPDWKGFYQKKYETVDWKLDICHLANWQGKTWVKKSLEIDTTTTFLRYRQSRTPW